LIGEDLNGDREVHQLFSENIVSVSALMMTGNGDILGK
jgi:hypothetical protein